MTYHLWDILQVPLMQGRDLDATDSSWDLELAPRTADDVAEEACEKGELNTPQFAKVC